MPTPYEEAILLERRKKDEQIKADSLHWMNLAGLFWLEEGPNSFGGDTVNKIAHPAFPKPFCGSFNLEKGQVTFLPAEDVKFSASHNGVTSRPLHDDRNSDPDLITIGSLVIKIIIRGGQPLIRMWDRESPAKANFSGLRYFPVNEEYRVPAKFIRHAEPRTAKKMEIIGTEAQTTYIGQVRFSVKEQDCIIEAEQYGSDLLLHFADTTNAKTTYGGGRRIYIPVPDAEEFILDLNLASNWPCAYTPYATCPVVPQENHLPIPIEAGEMKYSD